MAEVVLYKGKSTTIGTCGNIYYSSYEKFVSALNLGFLGYQPGNLSPEKYALPDSGFRFRFPFPDEDHFTIGDLRYDYSRGIPITVDRHLLFPEESDKISDKISLLLTQQRLSFSPGGAVILACVFKEPGKAVVHWIDDKEGVKPIIAQIIRSKVLYNDNHEERLFYRELAIRMLKGYNGLTLNQELKEASQRKKIKGITVPKKGRNRGL